MSANDNDEIFVSFSMTKKQAELAMGGLGTLDVHRVIYLALHRAVEIANKVAELAALEATSKKAINAVIVAQSALKLMRSRP